MVMGSEMYVSNINGQIMNFEEALVITESIVKPES